MQQAHDDIQDRDLLRQLRQQMAELRAQFAQSVVAEFAQRLLDAIASYYDLLWGDDLVTREELWEARNEICACFALYEIPVLGAAHYMLNHFFEDMDERISDVDAVRWVRSLMTEGLEGSHPFTRRLSRLSWKSATYGLELRWPEKLLRDSYVLLHYYGRRLRVHPIRNLIDTKDRDF
eukprot:gnl/Spiro4/13540_TR7212_c0_g1_i1.p1 gnl/Spiro4/13540_TR7212_c0_g1~~gnl/Spiro4/13540_TR7212_c0_g1_i1.p1  ORF type:complete len:178 (-),score=23.30 gnl/Spiro4/13540_TR7212_c0_g1_i1:84-617(-)